MPDQPTDVPFCLYAVFQAPVHGALPDDERAAAADDALAALEPAVAWAGHADPLRGDVRAALERAAGAS